MKIDPSVFRRHRETLARRLPDGLIVLSGGTPVARNFDVEYPFRQGSHFLYLTGVEEPGCHLLLDPRRGEEILFIPRIDNNHRVWLGHVPDPEEARRLYGFDRVLYADEAPPALRRARRGFKRLYSNGAAASKFRSELAGLKPLRARLQDCLEDLRAVKTPGELALMRRAGEISSRAHREVMIKTRPGMREYEIQAIFESACLREGLRLLAYPSIVAAGRNGAVLHYHRNDAVLGKNDLLLLDGGGEERGYAADITRTFPVSGKFSRRQRDVYQIVLETQKACINRARPGIVSAELHVFSMEKIAEGLKSLGLLKGTTSGLVESGAVRMFYPHGLTHMLGLDVHDVTGGRRRVIPNPMKVHVRFVARLEPGFVITMEPGIYFIEALINDPANRRRFRDSVDFAQVEKFLDFGGVRIEDDIVIRAQGAPDNLTSAPKEIPDVEEACGR